MLRPPCRTARALLGFPHVEWLVWGLQGAGVYEVLCLSLPPPFTLLLSGNPCKNSACFSAVSNSMGRVVPSTAAKGSSSGGSSMATVELGRPAGPPPRGYMV